MLGVDREGKGREGGVSHYWSPFLNRLAEAGSHIPPTTEELCLENSVGSLTGSYCCCDSLVGGWVGG